jgi:hypothetical protein
MLDPTRHGLRGSLTLIHMRWRQEKGELGLINHRALQPGGTEPTRLWLVIRNVVTAPPARRWLAKKPISMRLYDVSPPPYLSVLTVHFGSSER